MSRDFRLYLDDILEACRKIQSFTNGMTYDDFSGDVRTIDAVVRNLEIIGEAVKNIPAEWLSPQDQIEWKKIARLRDIIVHRYFRVEIEVVWDIIQDDIGELHEAVRLILNEREDPNPS